MKVSEFLVQLADLLNSPGIAPFALRQLSKQCIDYATIAAMAEELSERPNCLEGFKKPTKA